MSAAARPDLLTAAAWAAAGELRLGRAGAAARRGAPAPRPAPPGPAAGATPGLRCGVCGGVEFEDGEEQRAHCKGDLHRLNLRRKARGRAPLTEAEAERALAADGDLSSISGSEDEDEDEDEAGGGGGPAGAQVCFERGEREGVAVWKSALFGDAEAEGDAAAPETAAVERLRGLAASGWRWMVVLCSGGHFAAAVFDMRKLAGATGAKGGPAVPKAAALAHKTFHRYVIRAKSGGRQAIKDKAKNIKSAGSSIRRYNEQALVRDIEELLKSWADLAAGADLIFVHAPGPHNSQGIFGDGAGALSRRDARVRRVPFVVRRPTYKETCRVARELASAKPYDPQAAAAAAARKEQQAREKARGKGKPAEAPEAPAPPPAPFFQQPEAEAGVEDETPLHAAARAGDAARALELLEAGSDPAEKDLRGRTAYMVTKSKAVRDAFRRFRAAAGEGAWDWHAAGVPEALTAELEARKAEKDAKKKEKDKARKKAAKERKQKKALEEAERARAAEEARAREEAEQARRTEAKRAKPKLSRRELMAAAAERRMAALSLGKDPAVPVCANCDASLEGKTPFERLALKYCSPQCVAEHRQVCP